VRVHRRSVGVTVRVDDGEPGAELQVDFGELGMIPHEGARRLLRALVFTPLAGHSSHADPRPGSPGEIWRRSH
jgi:hypothetical protein